MPYNFNQGETKEVTDGTPLKSPIIKSLILVPFFTEKLPQGYHVYNTNTNNGGKQKIGSAK